MRPAPLVLLCLFLIAAAAASNAVMDTLSFTKIFTLPKWGWVAAFVGVKMLYGLVFEGLFAGLLIVR